VLHLPNGLIGWQSRVAQRALFLPPNVDDRMLLVLVLQICWMLRLSYNTFRRGLFKWSEEDYRWPLLRRQMPIWQFKIFSFAFIAFAQNYLLLTTALPQYLLLTSSRFSHPTRPPPPLGTIDLLIALSFIFTLCFEMIADNQQQTYQNWKYNSRKFKEVNSVKSLEEIEGKLRRGFCTQGLWAWSRHPNFACEQTTWFILYLFTLRATIPPSVPKAVISFLHKSIEYKSLDGLVPLLKVARPHLINYSLISPVSMSILFVASTIYTESISISKYPLYRQYRRRVAMLWWPETLFIKIPYLLLTRSKASVDNDVFGKATPPGANSIKSQ